MSDTVEKYLIYKAILEGKSYRRIRKELGCSIETILKIKKQINFSDIPYFKFDELGYLIYSIKNDNPFFTMKDIKHFLKEQYNIEVAVSSIANKLKPYCLYDFYPMPKNVLELFKMLIEDKNLSHASHFLKFYRLNFKDCYLLKNFSDEMLPIPLLVNKVIYIFENDKLSEIEVLSYLSKVNKLLDSFPKKTLDFYYLLFLKIYILQILTKFDKIFEIYESHEDEINKLPNYIKIEFLTTIASCYIKQGKTDKGYKLIRKLSNLRKLKNKDELLKLLVSIGHVSEAQKFSKDIFLYFAKGDYKKFIHLYKEQKNEIEGLDLKILYKCFYIISRMFLGLTYGFLEKFSEIERDVKTYKIHSDAFVILKSLDSAIRGEFEKAKEILKELSKDIPKTYEAIISGNYKILSRYRKQELLLKSLMMGNLKKAVYIARKYGLIYNLHLYSILLNKSFRNLKKYQEFRVILKMLKSYRKYKIRIYILRKNPRIYIDDKLFKVIKRSSNYFALICYLTLIKNNVSIYELEEEGFKNVKNLVYKINYYFGFKVISVKSNRIVLNVPFYVDYLDYLNNHKKKKFLLKAFPFDRLSNRFKFADELRESIITFKLLCLVNDVKVNLGV
jgi:hypothetical protein